MDLREDTIDTNNAALKETIWVGVYVGDVPVVCYNCGLGSSREQGQSRGKGFERSEHDAEKVKWKILQKYKKQRK